MTNDVIVTIKWTIKDVEEALVSRGIQPTDENMQRLLSGRFERTLQERSIEEGWQIIDDLISMADFKEEE